MHAFSKTNNASLHDRALSNVLIILFAAASTIGVSPSPKPAFSGSIKIMRALPIALRKHF